MRALLVAGGALALVLSPALASATPRALPFTYNYETNAEGEGEIETYIDLVPVKAINSNQNPQTVLLSQFQEEFEYGITNRLELGLYVTWAPPPSGFAPQGIVPSLTEANGSKQRLRYRILDPGVLPVDIGLYGEVTENENEIELEAKVILQKRFGALAIAANIVTEREFYFTGQADWIFDPSAGFWVQVTPVFQPGFEWWMYKEWTNQPPAVTVLNPTGTAFNLDDQQYVGPTMHLNLGRVWWTSGAYARVTNVDHTLTPGVDSFGKLWFRTVIGVNL
jgi:hypothetical protein